MTTAAQNIHVFLRKSPLHKNHFFEWLKTANFSTACGTVTLKSPPSRAFAAPHVHPRPRKRLARCTLDCGFKTSESPALRGFVAGLQALATAALYLVLKSNGLPRPKIRLKKFGFSSKSVPANIAKKLPLQLRPKPLFIAFFNFSHKWPTFAFTGESGYTLGSLRKIAHKGSHAETGVFRTGVVSLPSERSTRFGNPAWPGFKTAYFAAFGSWSDVLLKNAESLGTAMRSCVSLFRGVAAPLGCVIFFYFCQNCDFYALRTQGLSVCARRGWYHYPRCALCAVETLGARLSK